MSSIPSKTQLEKVIKLMADSNINAGIFITLDSHSGAAKSTVAGTVEESDEQLRARLKLKWAPKIASQLEKQQLAKLVEWADQVFENMLSGVPTPLPSMGYEPTWVPNKLQYTEYTDGITTLKLNGMDTASVHMMIGSKPIALSDFNWQQAPSTPLDDIARCLERAQC